MEKVSVVHRFGRALPEILFGVLLGLCWYLAAGYIFGIVLAVAMGGSKDAANSLFFLAPPVNIIVLALAFSCFRKYNVVTGILLVAIGFVVHLTYPVFHAFYAWHAQH